MIVNRQLILPYAAPFMVYVLFASISPDHLSIEINYIMRMVICGGILIWAWKWYVPIRGPRAPFVSVVLGILAGLIGALIWIIMLLPFTDSLNNDAWPISAFTLRMVSAGFLVPVFEEMLMRGFVFRLALQWGEARKMKEDQPLASTLEEKSINNVAHGAWSWIAVIISTLVFASGHHMYEWPASIAFGLLMSFLWIYRKDLIVCIVAHAVTNISLAFYVLRTDSWYLW